MRNMLFVIIAAFVMACDGDGENCCGFGDATVVGTWLLYEHGYSPGAGYIVEDVPPIPQKLITFHENGTMESNIGGAKDFKFYRLLEDDHSKVLAFFKELPINTPDVNHLETSYAMTFDENGHMTLSFRWCIEGCHDRYKKIK